MRWIDDIENSYLTIFDDWLNIEDWYFLNHGFLKCLLKDLKNLEILDLNFIAWNWTFEIMIIPETLELQQKTLILKSFHCKFIK